MNFCKKYKLFLAVLIPCTSCVSVATAAPMLSGTVDGMPFSIPPGLFIADQNSDVSVLDLWEMNFPSGDKVVVSAEFDPDPIVTYSIAVTDFGAASTFLFSFGQAIILPGGANFVDAQIGGALTDATGDGVSITPTLADSDGDATLEIQTSAVGFGVPSITMGVDVGLAESKAGTGGPAVSGYGTYSEPVQLGPSGAFDAMNVSIGFSLSGGGDTLALSGFAQIVPVPEPTSIWLVGCSILGLSVAGSWRKR